MPRSEASREQRRIYFAEWRKKHPDYHEKYREANRDRLLEQKRAWKKANPEKVRAQHGRYDRVSRAIPGIPVKFLGHPFFDQARLICGSEPRFWPESWEDEMGAVVLALVEGTDPNEAFKRAKAYEKSWQYGTGPIYDNIDIDAETLAAVVIKRRGD